MVEPVEAADGQDAENSESEGHQGGEAPVENGQDRCPVLGVPVGRRAYEQLVEEEEDDTQVDDGECDHGRAETLPLSDLFFVRRNDQDERNEKNAERGRKAERRKDGESGKVAGETEE